MSRFILAATAALFASCATAQTFTTCNPMNETCPEDPALGTVFDTTFNASMVELNPNFWNISAGEKLISFTDEGAEMSILEQGDSVTIETAFYMFWGQVDLVMKAAKGQGIISTINLLSDDLDEIDWEVMGSNQTHVSNNWYGKGNLSQHNGEYPVLEGAGDEFHTYSVNWTSERLQWLLDGELVREIPYAESGKYPQTPSFVKIGIWAGGDPTLPQGTIDWAGGETNYDEGPFTMTVKSVKVIDGTTNSSWYSYEDKSGSYQSINVEEGKSNAYKELNKLSHTEKLEKHWDGLSKTAKIGIAVGVIGAFVVGVIAFTAVCIVQRKKGRAEREAHDKEWAAHESELETYRAQMKAGTFAVSHLSTPNVKY